MKILFLGDIVSKPGREATKEFLGKRRGEYNLVVANGENLAGGYGITPKTAEEVFKAGVDIITTGNHTFQKKEAIELLESDQRIMRPANIYGAPGEGYTTVGDIAVINLMGRVFMELPLDCPFRKADEILGAIEANIKIVDFHAEATSEKLAMGFYLAGRVTAVVGTHTHVQTADEMIISGTGYITDCGMVGPFPSIIGMDKSECIQRLITGLPRRLGIAREKPIVQGVVIHADTNGKCAKIERFSINL